MLHTDSNRGLSAIRLKFLSLAATVTSFDTGCSAKLNTVHSPVQSPVQSRVQLFHYTKSQPAVCFEFSVHVDCIVIKYFCSILGNLALVQSAGSFRTLSNQSELYCFTMASNPLIIPDMVIVALGAMSGLTTLKVWLR